MTNRRPSLVFVGAILCCAVAAQAAPNLSGDWKMNPARSDYGPIPAPASLLRTIKHDDPNLHLKTVQSGPQGEVTVELKYTTDGKEWTNVVRGVEVKGTTRWDGEKLLIDYKRDFGGGPMSVKETWALSDGGKTITVNLNASGDAGSFDIKIVLEKQ